MLLLYFFLNLFLLIFICFQKQDQEIQILAEALRTKQIQFENIQRDFEYSIGPHIEDRIQKEKQAWEQEQNYLIRRELSKLSDEKNKEITKAQEELLSERDKNLKDREKMIQLEKLRNITKTFRFSLFIIKIKKDIEDLKKCENFSQDSDYYFIFFLNNHMVKLKYCYYER